MGYDCTSSFPKGTKRNEVEDFLILLGYELFNKKSNDDEIIREFSYFEKKDFRSITGIYAHLSQDKLSKEIKLWTRTTIWRSKFDSDFHNHTIKQLKLRFGGHFITDFGKNRYFKFSGVVREKAESGVYHAYSRFENNFKRIHLFINFSDLKNNEKHPIHKDNEFIDLNYYNPKITTTNIIVPYLLSAIEDFFRSVFIALLIYSENKEKIISNARVQSAELIDIDNGILSVCEAVAKWMNFQEMTKVNQSFKQLDKNIDIQGVLLKPNGRRKETDLQLFERLIDHRHSLIHRAEITIDYYPDDLIKDIRLINRAIWNIYAHIRHVYNWQDVHQHEF